VWKPDTTSNCAGYNVYRQQSGNTAKPLNPRLLVTPAFTDTTAEPRQRYSYWVTSVSIAGHESSPSAKVLVNAR
jgi:fibronectin type 3 domain-containing protein